MSAARARAGIVVTGTEVLTGRVTDRNGPWLSDRLRELGVDLAHITIVGDRREDMLSALRFLAGEGADLILTSGGLGPTADDLTAEVVGRFQGREMVLDEALEERIAEILRPMASRWPNLDMDAIRASNRKQAVVPAGSTILEPVGTAPGLVVPPGGEAGPTVVVLPGPPRELQPMWHAAVQTDALRAAIGGATEYRQTMLRLFGIPESEIAETLRVAEREGVDLDALEVTTCLRRGEIEIVTRYEPSAQQAWEGLERVVRERHADTLFSDDGRSVDQQVADLLLGREGGGGGGPQGSAGSSAGADEGAGLDADEGVGRGAPEGVGSPSSEYDTNRSPPRPRTIATAESCTGGLVAARLTDLPGSSAYFVGGIVAYSNEVKVSAAGVPAELIETHGAVSAPVADALARGAIERLGADVGVGVTGVAGPEGGTDEKPVGLVWFSVAVRDGGRLTRSVRLPGGRADIRDRATTVALHLVRRLLMGESDGDPGLTPAPEGALRRTP